MWNGVRIVGSFDNCGLTSICLRNGYTLKREIVFSVLRV